MPKVITAVKKAEALACLINKAVASDECKDLTWLREKPFAEVVFAPHVSRIKARKLRCFVEPFAKSVNSGETQDACSGEWLSTIGIVFAQKIDDEGNDENQPGDVCEVKHLVEFVEYISEKLLEDWNRIETDCGPVRIQKEDTDHELINREWLRDHQVFYSQINVTYG